MSIENDLKRIADALERIAGSSITSTLNASAVNFEKPEPQELQGAKPGRPKKQAEPVVTELPTGKPAPTLDDLTDVLREVVRAKGAPVAKSILQSFSADRISAVKTEQYQALYDELKKVTG